MNKLIDHQFYTKNPLKLSCEYADVFYYVQHAELSMNIEFMNVNIEIWIWTNEQKLHFPMNERTNNFFSFAHK